MEFLDVCRISGLSQDVLRLIVSAIVFVRLDKTDGNVLSLNHLAILSLCRRQQRGCTCTNEACVV